VRRADLSADTVVVFPPERVSQEANSNITSVAGMRSQVLEKPSSKEDQARMLDLMAGKECEVITGVTIGMILDMRGWWRRGNY
jgi:septum formation protein